MNFNGAQGADGGGFRSDGGPPVGPGTGSGMGTFGMGAFGAGMGASGFAMGGAAGGGNLSGACGGASGSSSGDGMGGNFVQALENLFIRRSTPKPALCTSVSKLPQFFRQFESYARMQYGNNTEYWMQSIGEFVGGEVSHIVASFGDDVSYFTFRDRVLKEFAVDSRVTGDTYKSVLEMKRLPSESLKCFHLRLENVVKKIDTKSENRDALILCALRNNVPADVLYQVDLQLSLLPKYSVAQFIGVCNTVNNTMTKAQKCTTKNSEFVRTIDGPPSSSASTSHRGNGKPLSCYRCGEEGHTSDNCTNRRVIRCFNCRETGHIAKNCPKDRSPGHNGSESSCGYCGRRGHLMKGCREFKQMLMSIREGTGDREDTLN